MTGTLRVARSLCLRNATLVQALVPADTTPYISRQCLATEDTAAVIDCGNPAISVGQQQRLWVSLAVRTLLIRPNTERERIRVNLDHVTVHRGPYTHGGSRTDSAGIWLEGADRVDFNDVKITGNGKGYGLLLMHSRNVSLKNLSLEDMVWSPYRGDAPLREAEVAKVGWNSVPIQEFRANGEDGVKSTKFYGVRIQEQLTCAFLANVQHVRIENIRVSRCMARFDTGDIPWQADGLDIGQSSSDVVIDGARIDSTWEGMDVVATGSGIDGLVINDLSITDAFAFGLKLGYRLRGTRIRRLRVRNAGLAGVVIAGPVSGTRLAEATIYEVGTVRAGPRTLIPWPAGNRAGIRLDEGSSGTEDARATPHDTQITDVAVANIENPNTYEYGILNSGGSALQIVGFQARGFGNAQSHANGLTR
ncbi:MAG: hypothetical protein ABIO43_03695 [Sphingomicrobium sp.]